MLKSSFAHVTFRLWLVRVVASPSRMILKIAFLVKYCVIYLGTRLFKH